MALYDEEEMRIKNQKERKLRKKIILGIVLSMVLIVILMVVIFILIYNPNKITISMDNGTKYKSPQLEQYFITQTTEEGKTVIYSPIRDIASIFGYTSGTGEYTTNLQDQDSCYVESEDEIAIFKLDSNVIYKIDKSLNKNRTSSEYEYEDVHIEYPIKKIDNKLYVEQEGLKKAFNILMDYNDKRKRITIYTLPYMVSDAEKRVKEKAYNQDEEYELDKTFSNRKAILDNRVVIISKDDKLKGVYEYNTKREICSPQYADITYIPQKERFLVKNQYDKVGILSNEGETKIRIQYDNLTLIDSKNELYLAENRLFGVVDINEAQTLQPKINLEYDDIGVPIDKYPANGLKTGKVLLGSIIPVKQQEKIGFYKIETRIDANGEKEVNCRQITNMIFQSIGCETRQSRGTVANIMTLEDYKVVIVRINDMYGLMDENGKVALQPVFSDIYMETTSGQTNYYMVHNNGKTYNVTEYLEKNGYKKQTK